MELQAAGIVPFKRDAGEIQYLILRHRQGHWAFPKGKVEAGETLQQAALRELEEETGLQAQIVGDFCEQYEYWFTDKGGTRFHKIVSIFLGRSSDAPVTLSPEHNQYAWLPFELAYKRLSYANSRHILRRAHNVLLSMLAEQ